MALSLLIFTFLALPARAQNDGYLVRVDTAAGDVFLDLGQNSAAKTGSAFVIYKEGDELTNPATGKTLGRMETKLAEGLIKEAHPLYAVGRVDKTFGPFAAGMRARLGVEPAPAPKIPSIENQIREPRWKSPMLDLVLRGLAAGDFQGDGSLTAALADEKNVYLYPYPPGDAKALSQYKLPGNSSKLLSLEAGDLDGNGKAELFATVFNEAFSRVETLVLELGADGQWAKKGEVPGAVRAVQQDGGHTVLAVQQLVEDRTFPFSSAYPLGSKDGKYFPGGKALRYKRADWVYAFTTADFDGKGPSLASITATDLIRLDFQKGHWKTEEAYGQTPVRFTWSGRILQCHPRMAARYTGKGFDALYLVRNIGSLGGLAQTFGYFSSAEIHRKEFNGLGLVTAWKALVNGYSPAIALVKLPDGGEELWAAVVGATGKSSLWIYDP